MATSSLHDFLGPELSDLLDDGNRLMFSACSGFHDYAFMIFPFAKVYEGFLKKLFLRMGAINQDQYNSQHWRVGKALNPQLEKNLRHESVYDLLDKNLAEVLWFAWKNGRNKTFHYFPGEHHPLSFGEAKVIIKQLNDAMTMALNFLNNGTHPN